jgi:hypothetical protein
MKQNITKQNEVMERDLHLLFDFEDEIQVEPETSNENTFIPMTHLWLLARLQEAEELLAA